MRRRSVTECSTASSVAPAVRDDSTSSTSSASAVAAATWSPRSKRPWAQERRSENGVVVFMRPTTRHGVAAFRRDLAPPSHARLTRSAGGRCSSSQRSPRPDPAGRSPQPRSSSSLLRPSAAPGSLASASGAPSAAPVPLRKTRRRLRFGAGSRLCRRARPRRGRRVRRRAGLAARGRAGVPVGRRPLRPSGPTRRRRRRRRRRRSAPRGAADDVRASVTMRAISRAGSRNTSVLQTRSCTQPRRASCSGRRRSRSRVLRRAAYLLPSVSTATSARPRW